MGAFGFGDEFLDLRGFGLCLSYIFGFSADVNIAVADYANTIFYSFLIKCAALGYNKTIATYYEMPP